MAKRLVKICGINSEEAFDTAFGAGADFVGFVFFPPSPRYVTPSQAAALSARMPGGPKRVGLFVGAREQDIRAALEAVALDILQIYAEPPQIEAVRKRFALPVWRSVGIAGTADLPRPDEAADGFVAEAKAPAGATRPGGNATQADWKLLAAWNTNKFWLLAGGLTPENVALALAKTRAPGADVSSGVESAPGVKSPDLIRRFIKAAQGEF
jgi:phosphoribosylanthranilate isomerase